MEMMPYVSKYVESLGEWAKVATDLASVLDHEVLSAATIAAQKYDPARSALQRLEVFEDVCALLQVAGAPVPELERDILEICRPQATSDKDALAVADLVKTARGRLGRKRPKADLRHDILAMCRCLERMPGLAPAYDGKLDKFRAVINSALIELGLTTIRPDYPERSVPNSRSGIMRSTKLLRVVVVDDDASLIVSTVRELAGWPGLTFIPFHFKSVGDRWSLPPEKLQQIVNETARAILELKPDIVCMDEGMPPINGGHVIKAMRATSQAQVVAYVGSTGGSGKDLEEAGALLNLEKGRHPEILARAISRF